MPGLAVRGGAHAGDQAGPAIGDGRGRPQAAAACRDGGDADGMLGAAAVPAAAAAATSTGTASASTAASWRIIKTTRGRDLPGITAVTATSPGHAWAFASTSARPVAWRLTGHRWAAVPFPGQAGDLVTAAASSARDNVWAFTARPAGAGQALRWDGRHWVTVRRFAQAIGDAVVLGPADVWVFGQPLSRAAWAPGTTTAGPGGSTRRPAP